MVASRGDINNVRDTLFKRKVYLESTEELRGTICKVLLELVDKIKNVTGGGLTLECALESLLVVVGWCCGPANVRIHGNYKKAVSKIKVIVAPISALKSPPSID